jgi:hypothetical protein
MTFSLDRFKGIASACIYYSVKLETDTNPLLFDENVNIDGLVKSP